jgi:Zn-dependent protease
MLGWSINLFRVFGIRLAVHFTFFILVAYAAWAGWADNPKDPWMGMALDVALILLLFTCIVLHELGHSLIARRYGIGVSRILLLPIGGMAEFESIPRQPRRELLISLAGPAVNFSIVLLLLLFLPWPKGWGGDTVELTPRGLADLLLQINLIMGGFSRRACPISGPHSGPRLSARSWRSWPPSVAPPSGTNPSPSRSSFSSRLPAISSTAP